jgi:hypothetical protein
MKRYFPRNIILSILVLSAFAYTQIYESTADTIETDQDTTKQERKSALVTRNDVHPIVFDTTGIGTMNIATYPKDAEVFVNGCYIGKGKQLLTNLKTGMYCVNAKYGFENSEKYVLVQKDKLNPVDFTVGRTTWFIVEPSFNICWINGNACMGPSLDLGVQHKNFYYGIDYYWNFSDWDPSMWGGSAFKFRYSFNFKDIFSISPGFMCGFWYSESKEEEYSTSYGYTYDDWEDNLYFGGFCCRANIGYKFVFFQIEISA